jgi:SHS2 domain-containing protein
MCDYSYFDHDADIGISGRGETVESAFESAAEAVFSIMTDTSALQKKESVSVSFEEEDLEFALVRWLNALISLAHSRHLVLGHFSLKREGDRWRGEAWGETWRKEMTRGVEVKGATLTMLSVTEEEGIWTARCIVDV